MNHVSIVAAVWCRVLSALQLALLPSLLMHAKDREKSVLCPFPSQLLMIAAAPGFPLGPRNAHLKNHPDVHGGCQPQFLMQ